MSGRENTSALCKIIACILLFFSVLAVLERDTAVAFRRPDERLIPGNENKYKDVLDLLREATEVYMQSLDSNDVRIANTNWPADAALHVLSRDHTSPGCRRFYLSDK